MIQVTAQMRILLAVEPVDFRKGIDGLARICRRELASDPFSGRLFVFSNRRRTAIKVLVYDGQGFWLSYKRLSRGRFHWWGKGSKRGRSECLEASELQLLLWNGDPGQACTAPFWRRIAD